MFVVGTVDGQGRVAVSPEGLIELAVGGVSIKAMASGPLFRATAAQTMISPLDCSPTSSTVGYAKGVVVLTVPPEPKVVSSAPPSVYLGRAGRGSTRRCYRQRRSFHCSRCLA